MHKRFSQTCLVSIASLVIVWNFPISNSATRFATVAFFVVAWISLLAAAWPRRSTRFAALTLTLFVGAFVLLPSSRMPPPEKPCAQPTSRP